MRPPERIEHEFVEVMPESFTEGTLYISIPYTTCCHLCFCGCGQQVVTPLSPTDWRLTFDGDTVSLHPSVGSWNLDCQSHYWIRGGRVHWAEKWEQDKIEANRKSARRAKSRYYGDADRAEAGHADGAGAGDLDPGWVRRVWRWLRR